MADMFDLDFLNDNLWTWIVIAIVALVLSIVGGVSGYGVGLVLPVFIAPVVGLKEVIPVMSVAVLITNASRLFVFRSAINIKLSFTVLLAALPGAILGAYTFVGISERFFAVAFGVLMLLSIPARRYLAKTKIKITNKIVLSICGFVFGFFAGAATGTGPLLIAILMATGLSGVAVVATDAAISTGLNVVRLMVFSGEQLISPVVIAQGVLIGLCTIPGSFIARHLVQRLSANVHIGIIELIIFIGSLLFFWRAYQL